MCAWLFATVFSSLGENQGTTTQHRALITFLQSAFFKLQKGLQGCLTDFKRKRTNNVVTDFSLKLIKWVKAPDWVSFCWFILREKALKKGKRKKKRNKKISLWIYKLHKIIIKSTAGSSANTQEHFTHRTVHPLNYTAIVYLQKNSHKSKFWILWMDLIGWSIVLSYSLATSLNS